MADQAAISRSFYWRLYLKKKRTDTRLELPTGLPDDFARWGWERRLAHPPYLFVYSAGAEPDRHAQLRNVLAVPILVVEEELVRGFAGG